MSCPRCKRAIIKDAIYCPYCGFKIKGDQGYEDILKTEIEKVKRWRLIGALIALFSLTIPIFAMLIPLPPMPIDLIFTALIGGLEGGLFISGLAIFLYYDHRKTKLTRALKGIL